MKPSPKGQYPPMSNEAPSTNLPIDKLPEELTDNEIEEKKEAFKKALVEGKQKLKNRKSEEYNKEKSKRYEKLEQEYNNESKKQIAHENLILKGYDEVISKLESLSTKNLNSTERKEINEMLRKIDESNIGAIKTVQAAIKRLKSKVGKIEEEKLKIMNKNKKQEEERKAPRRVSRSSNIIEFSKLSSDDSNSDYNVKKKIKIDPQI